MATDEEITKIALAATGVRYGTDTQDVRFQKELQALYITFKHVLSLESTPTQEKTIKEIAYELEEGRRVHLRLRDPQNWRHL